MYGKLHKREEKVFKNYKLVLTGFVIGYAYLDQNNNDIIYLLFIISKKYDIFTEII